jgi:hypothetical protein
MLFEGDMMVDDIEVIDPPMGNEYVEPLPVREVRNPVYNAVGGIDCEILHETFGWIPFSAGPDDTDPYGIALYEQLVAGEQGTIGPYAPSPAQARAVHDFNRDVLVEAIQVTTLAGHVFDGDEVSQNRLARAIVVLRSKPPGTTIKWVLANNTVIDVALTELLEALTAAFAAQTAIWIQP